MKKLFYLMIVIAAMASCKKEEYGKGLTTLPSDTTTHNNTGGPILGTAMWYIKAQPGDVWYGGFTLWIEDTLMVSWPTSNTSNQTLTCDDPNGYDWRWTKGTFHFHLRASSNWNNTWDSTITITANGCVTIPLKNQLN